MGYNLKGCLCSIGVGFPFRERGVDIGMSEAPDGLLDNFEDGGRGVLVPLDDVFVLIGVPTPDSVGILEAR